MKAPEKKSGSGSDEDFDVEQFKQANKAERPAKEESSEEAPVKEETEAPAEETPAAEAEQDNKEIIGSGDVKVSVVG